MSAMGVESGHHPLTVDDPNIVERGQWSTGRGTLGASVRSVRGILSAVPSV